MTEILSSCFHKEHILWSKRQVKYILLATSRHLTFRYFLVFLKNLNHNPIRSLLKEYSDWLTWVFTFWRASILLWRSPWNSGVQNTRSIRVWLFLSIVIYKCIRKKPGGNSLVDFREKTRQHYDENCQKSQGKDTSTWLFASHWTKVAVHHDP